MNWTGEYVTWLICAALMGLGLLVQLALLIRASFWRIKLKGGACAGCDYRLEGLPPGTPACPECGRKIDHRLNPRWAGPGFWRKLRHPLFIWAVSAILVIAPANWVFWVRHRVVQGTAAYRIPLKAVGRDQPFTFQTQIESWGQSGFVSVRDYWTVWFWDEPDHYMPLILTPAEKGLSPLTFEAGTRTVWIKGYAQDWAMFAPERTLSAMEKAALEGGDAVHLQLDLKPELVKKVVESQWRLTLEDDQEKIIDALLEHVVKNPPGTHLPNQFAGIRPSVVPGPAGYFGRGEDEIIYWRWIYISCALATLPALIAVCLRLRQMKRERRTIFRPE